MFNNIKEKIKSIFFESSHPGGGGGKYTCLYGLRNNGSAVFDYSFLMSLDEKEYEKYLKRAYFLKTGKKLNLKHPKDINEKIQWLKLYDNLPIKTTLTDKVLVRDWVKDKIGAVYLKPVLQICQNFDEINFDSFPETFIIKCNHGCRWHAIIKNKKEFLENLQLKKYIKEHIDSWLTQSFFGWSDFELQYKNIKPQIIVEQLLRENVDKDSAGIQIYFFNSAAQIIYKYQRILDSDWTTYYSAFDKNYNPIDIKFEYKSKQKNEEADNLIKEAVDLSKKLAYNFKFVRVDWLIYKGKLYFEELTFTPYSGYFQFFDKYAQWNRKLGNMLNLKGN